VQGEYPHHTLLQQSDNNKNILAINKAFTNANSISPGYWFTKAFK